MFVFRNGIASVWYQYGNSIRPFVICRACDVEFCYSGLVLRAEVGDGLTE